MFSVTYTGTNLFPLCTAKVWPTNSGRMVLARLQVFTTRFSFLLFRICTLSISASWTNGPFLTLLAMRYLVALPRLRPRTISLVEAFFRCRVLRPSGLPQGDVGGRPPELLPSPPPSGWSTGFIATPRTLGRLPSQRLFPALPTDRSSCSEFPTSPTVARHRPWISRISVERSRRVTY